MFQPADQPRASQAEPDADRQSALPSHASPSARGPEMTTYRPERRVDPPVPADSFGAMPARFGRRTSDTYLESMIATASPARLRLMLIERGVEVARRLAEVWRENKGRRGTNEHSLKLFELLSELLSGVTDEKVEVCRTVADLYVFLCQHLIKAEDNGDPTMIDEIRLVLETEAETWRMVCAQEAGQSSTRDRAVNALSGGLNLQG